MSRTRRLLTHLAAGRRLSRSGSQRVTGSTQRLMSVVKVGSDSAVDSALEMTAN